MVKASNTDLAPRERVRVVIESVRFEKAITTLIVANAITLGIETSPLVVARFGDSLHVFDNTVLGVFVVELLSRFFVYRSRFFQDPWRVFDFVVVGIALMPAGGAFTVLRALRVLRVLRLISLVPSMRRVVGALLKALPGMASIVGLMALVLYVSAVMATKLFGTIAPELFGDLGASLLLRLEKEWAKLKDPKQLDKWLADVTQSDWNVFIEGPPHGKSDPATVLKYLARYLTGGPISDGRIIGDENGVVTFWARSKDKAAGNPSREFSLSGKEFVRRWSMHILPKGYTRSRCYGGYHGSKRKDYLNRCRELLSQGTPEATAATVESKPSEEKGPSLPTCPRCEIEMRCIESHRRPSWKVIFNRRIYAEKELYSPMFHCRYSGASPFPYEPDG